MRSPLIVFVPLLVLLGAAPSAASAASISVDRGCYADPGERADTVQLTGTGFTPNALYQVTLDGQPLTGGTGMTDASGNVSGHFSSPQLASGTPQHRYTLGVEEGADEATTQFTVSGLSADFAPASGNPKTLKVRFSLFGFGLSDAAHAPVPVYLHYVRPDNGHVQRTVKLGTAGGACGSLKTAKQRLFPFAPKHGTWQLQFDLSPTYKPPTKKTSFLYLRLAVKVKGA